MPHSQIKSLGIGRIRLDGDTQSREKLDEQTLAAYAADIEAGAKFPPADVFFDETDYWMGDGFHQIDARKELGKDRITCRVHKGTREDARWYSYGANQAHGLRRTNADKARAVKRALKHPNGAKTSDGMIASHVGVSDRFVGKLRAESTPNGSELPARIGRDGRTRNTSNIGAKPAAQTPQDIDVQSATEPEEGDRFCPDCDGALGHCGCVEESPEVEEEGPPDAPEPDPAPARTPKSTWTPWMR